MKETSSDPPDIESQRTGARPKTFGFLGRSKTTQPDGSNSLPLTEPSGSKSNTNTNSNNSDGTTTNVSSNDGHNQHGTLKKAPLDEKKSASQDKLPAGSHPPSTGPLTPATPAQDQGQGSVVETDGNGDEKPNKRKRTIMEEIKRSFWLAITHSWINLLLVFVPVGIIVANVGNLSGGIIFAMNSIAIIPLAGLLAYATESVASKMGDSLGALLNVTFGNAVELIIFIIALAKNEIRIVQASLLGSILANLLLILGMGFFMGGLRYREQIYNSTVTQMSACLLSLSVISLVLPTAFYASFQDTNLAQRQSIKVSRGTSVILLLVYIIYLLFQLKSHAYMYESTPQHIVDAESTPGPAAGWLDSSDSSDTSSSDSSDSDHSHDTVRRKMKKVLRGGRRRKSSIASVDTAEMVNFTRTSSFGTNNASPQDEVPSEGSSSRPQMPRGFSGDANEDDLDDEKLKTPKKHRFSRRKHRKSKKKASRHGSDGGDLEPTISERPENVPETRQEGEPRRVDFAVQNEEPAELESGADSRAGGSRRPFPNLRGMSVKNLTPSVFTQKPDDGNVGQTMPVPGTVPRVRYGIRRTNSLPDRLSNQRQIRPPGAMLPAQLPLRVLSGGPGAAAAEAEEEEDDQLTRPAAIVLLLLTTALVSVCAEFLVSSIEQVTQTSSVGEIFIGLIILPIVGNAAEHVTALTVAMKNKMDLAIGVAVGSSIQIALFVTPLVVLLGWMMDKEMTLHFTLFETVCLFVSAFIVNFLVLDGRSNYLEGALLCAVYIIIAVVAFFYPDADQAANS